MFGNITGGGTLSSNTDYNPTQYVDVYEGSLTKAENPSDINVKYYFSVILPEDLYYSKKIRAFENNI